MKETILKELCSSRSKCRVVFATMALGMGVNIPSVREVIHIGPPRSVREYFQEPGHARRDNKQSHAILYYNNHDIQSEYFFSSFIKTGNVTTSDFPVI